MATVRYGKTIFVRGAVYLLLLSLNQSEAQTVFKSINDGKCFHSSSGALAVYTPIDHLMCVFKCVKSDGCALVSLIRANGTCLLYAAMGEQKYASMTSPKPDACYTWVLKWLLDGSIIFSASGLFTVPAGISFLKVLAVGGGGGGSCDKGGGGGSGFVNFNTFSVAPFQNYTITIGAGGATSSNGGATIFGNNLLTANGGSGKCNCVASSGGSGGGAGCGSPSGSGGSGGSAGSVGGTASSSGTGQGSSFTSNFTKFQLNVLSAAPGAAGITQILNYIPGGGGGGGVLINGAGPSASNGSCFINGALYGPLPARGYGAGGSGGCHSGTLYAGGKGASGLIYIEYS